MHFIVHRTFDADHPIDHQLMFSELTFMPDFNTHMFDPKASEHDRKDMALKIYRTGGHWPRFTEKLRFALNVQKNAFPELKSAIICSESEDDLIQKMKDLKMDSLIPEIEKMPHYEWIAS